MTLDPTAPGPISQEIAEVDERGRIRFLAALAVQTGWIPAGKSAVDSLAVLSEPGLIVLLSWADNAGSVVARRRELIKDVDADPDALEALRALEERYKRIRIPKDLRPTLTGEVLLHLGIVFDRPSAVYVTRIQARLELASTLYRNQRLASSWKKLEGLPE